MARGKGKRTGQLLSRQGRAGGESTSVESSSRFSEDSQFPVPSGAGTITRKKGKNRSAKLYGSGDFSREGDRDGHKPGESSSTADDNAVEIDTAAGKPGKELREKGRRQFISGFISYFVHVGFVQKLEALDGGPSYPYLARQGCVTCLQRSLYWPTCVRYVTG